MMDTRNKALIISLSFLLFILGGIFGMNQSDNSLFAGDIVHADDPGLGGVADPSAGCDSGGCCSGSGGCAGDGDSGTGDGGSGGGGGDGGGGS